MSGMNDKVALITGASSGIGRATAELFAARGAKVVLAARREHELATLTSEIGSRGGGASFVVTDVAIAKDVERMVAHAIETFGRLDYAVNNAGIEGKLAGITDLPEQEWRIWPKPTRTSTAKNTNRRVQAILPTCDPDNSFLAPC